MIKHEWSGAFPTLHPTPIGERMTTNYDELLVRLDSVPKLFANNQLAIDAAAAIRAQDEQLKVERKAYLDLEQCLHEVADDRKRIKKDLVDAENKLQVYRDVYGGDLGYGKGE